MTPRISIIMPAYNAGRYIAESINSVLDQTLQDWELIIIDDGSTDNTAKIVQEFARRDRRIKLLRQGNAGQADARNAGLRCAVGEYVAFLDADDLWVKEKLELQIATIEKESVDLVFSDGWIFKDEAVERHQETFATPHGLFAGAPFFKMVFAHNVIPILSVLARRKVLSAVNFFQQGKDSSEDYELWLRLIKHQATFYGMNRQLVYYRVHNQSSSNRTVRWHRAMIKTLREQDDSDYVDKALRRRRYESLYRRLVLALIAEGKPTETRQCLKETTAILPLRGRFILLWLLLRALPHQSQAVYLGWLKLRGISSKIKVKWSVGEK